MLSFGPPPRDCDRTLVGAGLVLGCAESNLHAIHAECGGRAHDFGAVEILHERARRRDLTGDLDVCVAAHAAVYCTGYAMRENA